MIQPTPDKPQAWASSVPSRANQLLSAAQYDSCLPKNRVDFDIPLFAGAGKSFPARMLTESERREVWDRTLNYDDVFTTGIRKFCEVNRIALEGEPKSCGDEDSLQATITCLEIGAEEVRKAYRAKPEQGESVIIHEEWADNMESAAQYLWRAADLLKKHGQSTTDPR